MRPADLPRVPAFRPDGRLMDLAAVSAEDVDFAEMAAGLAKLARFAGRYRCASYSVAQHSVFCADALYLESGDALLAGCGLLHDGHEYLIGDVIRPTVDLIADRVAVRLSVSGAREAVHEAVGAAKADIDRAVYTAAGIGGYPDRYPIYQRHVAAMDERMLRAETAALFGRAGLANLPPSRLSPPPLKTAIEPWGPAKAELAFLDRLERYLSIVTRAA